MDCAYCGNQLKNDNKKTKEHIPPKSFFLKGANNLITIPTCYDCNNSKSHNDELIKNFLLMTDLAAINPNYQPKIKSTIRSIIRPEKKHYRQELLKNLHYDRLTKSSISFDKSDINEWIGRNAQGVLFHEGQIKICTYEHKTFLVNLFKQDSKEELKYIKNILAITKKYTPVTTGTSKEFKYWILKEEQGYIVIQCFYEEIFFVSLFEKLDYPNINYLK